MSVPFLLTPAQMRRIRPHFPLSHGVPRWRDAPPGYGPHKTLYNRFVRWTRMGVFVRIFAALAGEPDRLIIDSTHLKAHRTAASLLESGLLHAASAEPRAG